MTLIGALGCELGAPDIDSAGVAASRAPIDSGFASVSDSAWVDVIGPTLIGFYPIATNEQLERDADLATVLDDFAYHIGTAMDSLDAAGVRVHYRGGDTLWLRSGTERWKVIRTADSADVGYVLTDTTRTNVVIYGVRTYMDLIDYVHEFKRTGQVRPR
jgi:hypothetical protein